MVFQARLRAAEKRMQLSAASVADALEAMLVRVTEEVSRRHPGQMIAAQFSRPAMMLSWWNQRDDPGSSLMESYMIHPTEDCRRCMDEFMRVASTWGSKSLPPLLMVLAKDGKLVQILTKD